MAVTSWLNTLMDNDGDNAANWSGGVPDSTTDVTFTSDDNVTFAGSCIAKTIDFTGYSGTFGTNLLTMHGDATFSNTATFSTLDVEFHASATLITGGATGINSAYVDGSATLTLGADCVLGSGGVTTVAAATLAFGANDLTLGADALFNIGGSGGVTWSAGAHLIFTNGASLTASVTLPPTTGAGNMVIYSLGQPDSYSQTGGTIHFDGAGGDVDNDMSLSGVTLVDCTFDITMTVGGNFTCTNSNLDGSMASMDAFSWNVTGTATATGGSFTDCNFGPGSDLNATDSMDGGGNTGINFISGNEPPVADAGADDTVIFPGPYALQGDATDPDMDELTYLWEKVSGPGSVTFDDDTDPTTDATFSLKGVYVLRLTADDGDLSDSDEVTITVSNSAPVADAGADDTVSFPGPYTLAGSSTDADMDEATYLWEKVSGPGTATFVDDTDPETDVTFSEEGEYVLRLTADDGTDSDSDEVTITVSNEGPSADAGKDQSITIPQTGNLDATGSTDDGAPVDPGALTYLWEYVSGPAAGYQIADAELAHTSVSFSLGGTYVFKVTVDDGEETDTDTVTITVTQHGTGAGGSGPFQKDPPRGNINSSFFKTKGK